MKYESGEITLNKIQEGFKVKWCVCGTTNSFNDGECEKINIEIINGENKIDYIFHNSIMEREISRKLSDAKERMSYHEFANAVRSGYFKPLMWGGYDKGIDGKKINNIISLIKKRIYYLIYSVLVDFSGNQNFSEYNNSFEDFCGEFGYEEDSRKSETIYNACLEMEKKFNSLKLNQEALNYLERWVRQEEEEFGDYIKAQIGEQY